MQKFAYCGTKNVAIYTYSSGKFLGYGKYACVKDLTNFMSGNKDAKPEVKWKLGPTSSQLYFRKKEVHMIQCLFQPDSHPRMADSCLAKGV